MQRLVIPAVTFGVILGSLTASAQKFTTGSDVPPQPSASSAAAPETAPRLTAPEIVARMLTKNQERLSALAHYESERTYRVEYHGTGGEHHAEIRVHAEYTGPNQKHFTVVSETGPKFLCEKVLRKLVESEQEASSQSNRNQMTLSPENYSFALLGEDTTTSERAWMLEVSPKVDSKFSYRGKVWISESDYAIMRIAGEPAKSPSFWIDRASFDSRYMRRGDVWLPERNVSTSHVRIGGQATLTIDYGNYPVVVASPLHDAHVVLASTR